MHHPKPLVARLTGLAFTLLVCLAAHSQSPPAWSTFASLDERPSASVAPNQSRLLFLRPGTSPDSGAPVDIWIDGRFHTTVLPGGFSEALVCAGRQTLELARQWRDGPAPKALFTVPSQVQQTSYVLIQTQGDKPTQSLLNAEQAQALLPKLRRQSHALSRVISTPCPPTSAPVQTAQPMPAPAVTAALAAPTPMPAPLPVPVAAQATPSRYTLAAEMLFNFNGHKPQHLSEQGQTQILRLGKAIKEQLRPGQVVVVQGHTDPMGPPTLNKRLSLERAQTVSRILINSGLPAKQVRSEGLGSSQLVVKDCDREAKTRDDKLKCNRPNRRVEISVSPAKN